MAALDLIRYYAIATVEDDYLGKCPNTYDNKCILLVGFSDFFALWRLQQGSRMEITARSWTRMPFGNFWCSRPPDAG